VGALGDDPQWTEAFPSLARAGQDRKFRRLLEETETLHRNAADRLRSLGLEDLARRAEQFAAWTRLDLDEPQTARRLYTATRGLREIPRLGSLFAKILEGAMTLAGADRGNVQLLDPTTRAQLDARSLVGSVTSTFWLSHRPADSTKAIGSLYRRLTGPRSAGGETQRGPCPPGSAMGA